MEAAAAVAALLLLLALSAALVTTRSRRSSGTLPPSPMALPLIGHLHLIRPPPHRALDRIVSRYGPLVYLRLGPSTHCVVAGTADAARDLLKFEASIPERPLTAVTRHLAYDDAGFAFAPYGPHWRFMKRLCMSELLGPRTVEQLRPVREAELAAVLRAARDAAGRPMDVSRQLIGMSNNAIMRMVASSLPGHMTEAARDCAKHVAEVVGAFNLEDYVGLCKGWDLQGLTRKTREVRDKFDALLEIMITAKEEARRRKAARGEAASSATTKDLLDILMDAAEDQNAEVKLTRENIKAFVLDIFTAGSDTTATSVEWMLAHLINNPACLGRLRQELDAVVGGSRLVGEHDVVNLPYLQAVFKETLRLQPPAVFAQRETVEPVHVRGYTIPPKTTVFFNIFSIGRDPAWWEEPLQFRPERFMPGGEGAAVDPKGQHMQLMPFGSGRRACPGMGLAMQAVPAFLAALVQCFDWAVPVPPGQSKAPPLDMEEADGLVAARKHPLLLIPTPRFHPLPRLV
ncbi:unnamed protein product [Urochloa decumbens]|uniref:Uncharacterized protein n=1 Tax=Urochloa decumbens TaxID=240449 RepID=A0ABC9B8W7_9POAL